MYKCDWFHGKNYGDKYVFVLSLQKCEFPGQDWWKILCKRQFQIKEVKKNIKKTESLYFEMLWVFHRTIIHECLKCA